MGDWTDSTGWHMELWSMLILSGQLVLLMICVKIYQCMVVGCCRADAEKKVEGTQTIAHTIWIMLTNLEIFVTIGMLVADIVASFHIWGSNPTDEGKVYEHGDLFKERMLT